jgi:hypothetical protein
MELLEVIKGRAYLSKEYRARDFEVGHQMSVDAEPFSRRVIDYKIIINEKRKYWKEIKRREFMHFSVFFGDWKEGWNHSEEELARQTII